MSTVRCMRIDRSMSVIEGTGCPKKIVHSNFLTPGHDFLTGSSNFGSQHHFQNLQAKGVYKSKSLFLKLISVSKQPKLAPVQVRGNTHRDSHPSSSVYFRFFVFLIVLAIVFIFTLIMVLGF